MSFTRTRYEASEDDTAVQFRVRLSKAASQDAVVEYETSSGTARAGEDYEATSGTLTFPAGTTEQTIRVPIIDDEVVEEEETFTITLRNSNATIESGEAAGAIADNDLPAEIETPDDLPAEEAKIGVTVSFAATRSEASEDDAMLEFPVQLSIESLQEVMVDYATASGTARAGEDYQVRRGTLTFPAGTTEQTIRVPIIDDEVVEEEETFTITLRNSNATIESGEATGAIADNDILAEVSIAADQTAVAEGGTAAFTLTRVGTLSAPLTVPVRVTERGSFLAAGAPTEATFAANAATATLLVATDDDVRDEADGAVTATLMDGRYQLGDAASATVLVTDNDVRGVTVTPTALTMREGESANYTVVLNTEPTADVTVSVLVSGGAEVAVAPTALTFTQANWRTTQTVAVTATHDADSVADNPVTIRHAVSGGDYSAVTAASVVVTIFGDDLFGDGDDLFGDGDDLFEDDPPTIQIADATASEGDGAMAFAVQLSVASIQTVTVEYATADDTAIAGTDYEATTGTLTFSAGAMRQTIRVPIIDDDHDEVAEAFTIALSGPENSTIADGEATGVIIDNDLPVVSIAADRAGVIEGDTVSFTLTRVGNLTAVLTVPVSITERGAFLADEVPTEATFAANAVTTTLQVATDDDERDEAHGTVTATITSGATHRVGDAASATVPVIDNDVPVTPGVTVTPPTLAVLEGSSANYAVVLDAKPTADVTVAVQVPEDADGAVDETELTFTAENWNQAQTVTVTAAHDDDAVADAPVTIRHAVSGGNYDAVTAASVEVTIIEDDAPTISIANAAAAEGDGEMAFAVRMSVASSQTVTVEYATADVTATAGTDYEETTSTLTFPALETAQTIRVPIIDDDLDEALEAFAVALSNASNATIADGEAAGVIADNDLPVVGVAADSTAVEEGETVTFVLARIGDLTVPLTVPVSITERGAFLADGAPSEATFAANEAIVVLPVATVDDDMDEVNGLVTATIMDMDGANRRMSDRASATVPVTDNDVRGVTVTPTELTVDEGDSASYTVVLTSEPTADVTVAVQVPEDAEGTVDETELTFTAENWNQAQTITVTAAQDADAVADEPVTIRHTVSGGDYDAMAAGSVEVTITEDDMPKLLIADAAAAEGDGEMAFAVRLSVLSSQTVTVEYATADGTAMADTDYEGTTGTLTFPALEMEQTIRVPIIDDDLDEATEAFTITLSNASNAVIADGETTGVIGDNDLPVVSVTADPIAVEEGETVTFTLTRIGDLTVPLTVPISITERGAFLADRLSTEVTFAADAKTTTFLVATDDDERDEADGAVTATITSGTTHRVGESANATVTVSDNDVRGVTVTPTELTVDEGDSASYTAVLTSEPTADVTIAIQVPDDADIALNQTALTFTSENWNQAQTIAVTAAHDDDAVADEPAVLEHTIRGGDYEGVTAAEVEVTITEDDTAGVTLSTDALELPEGDSQSYTVVLDTEPAADVTVAIQVSDNADIAVDQTALTFTADNWNTPQMVSVTAAHDDDAVADEPVLLTHAVSGGDYESLTAASVEVAIIEDDTPRVALSATALTVTEGGSQSYTMVLDTEPAADVTIVVAVPENAEVAVAETALTFTADNWNTPQTVTVTAAHDDDAVADEPVLLTHAVSGGDYEDVTASEVTITITEDDTPTLTIADADATEDDEEITFTVQLNVASSLAVTVDWATADGTATQGADYAETTGTLSFDALETEQTITVPLLDDALDEADETFTIALSNPSNATLDDAEATGTITDNDAAPALTIADAQAAEGDREITFAVTLGAVSSFAVTVDWTTADGTATADADYTAADGRLTFASGQTEATIAVMVFNDALDEGTETLTVALSNPTNATIDDDTATGTITDDDPSVEKAWLARFGRTAASQVMDAVSDRLTGRSGGDAHLTVGGQRVTLAAMSGQEEVNATGRTVPDRDASFSNILSRQPFYHLQRSSFADIISRSSFQLSAAADAERDVRWTAWGRGATTRFRSEEADLSLTGGPVTALLGVDRQQGRTLAGLAVAHSVGTGEFDVHTAEERFRKGELGTYLTSVHPYLRVAMTERLSAWGLLGYGRGQMERMADRTDADIAMQMGGLGARGTLLSPTASSAYDVALKSDAFLVRTDADAAVQPTLETMTSRLRLLLEGGRPVELDSGRMTPSLEVGMRHDGGDAETGLGLEVGGSLGYTHAQRGIALQATARRLLVHQATGYEEWGVGGSLNIAPGALGRGPSLRMHSSWGVAGSGMDRLWSQRSAADLAQSTQATEAGLFNAELGYGLDALGGLLTPYARIASGRDTHTYSVGGRLRVEQSLRVDLVAERRERTTARSSHEFKLHIFKRIHISNPMWERIRP